MYKHVHIPHNNDLTHLGATGFIMQFETILSSNSSLDNVTFKLKFGKFSAILDECRNINSKCVIL